jgi:hypothetical protein
MNTVLVVLLAIFFVFLLPLAIFGVILLILMLNTRPGWRQPICPYCTKPVAMKSKQCEGCGQMLP